MSVGPSRELGGVFDTVADDEARPTYPDELHSALSELSGVGAGILTRGLPVDPGAAMPARLRSRSVPGYLAVGR